MAIRLTTLGRVRVHVDDAEVPDLPAQGLRHALFVYLAVERDVQREAVLELFWPESDSGRRRHACRQALYELRQALGEEWLDGSGDRIRTFVDVDAHAFEAAATANRADDAASLYTGEFLSGFVYDNGGFESWVERRRAHLGRLYRKLQRQRIANLAGSGRADEALAAARAWVEVDTLDDEAAHALIEQLAKSGDRIAALQYFDAYARQLRTSLDVEPLDDTKALVESIRKSDFGAARSDAEIVEHSVAPRTSDPVEPVLPATSFPGQETHPELSVAMKWWPRAGVGAAAILLMAASAVFMRDRMSDPPSLPDRTVQIAVMPFEDHSPEGSLGALSNELVWTLVRSLSASESLEVISPNGIREKRAQGVSEDSVGRTLGADYVVAGSVTRSADTVFLAIELMDGRNHTVLNSAVVRRPTGETRNLIEDVVQQASTSLRRHVNQHVEIERIRAHTTSEEAWQLVLEAKTQQGLVAGLLRRGRIADVEHRLAWADSLLERAAELDRGWAEPVALRGRVLEQRAFVQRLPMARNPMLLHDLLVDARDMAERALERDDRFAEAHALRGSVLHQLATLPDAAGDMQSTLVEAERSLRRATELDPLAQDSWGRLAEILYAAERYDEALDAAVKAYRIDPYAERARSIIRSRFATALELGADDQAESWCQEGRRRYPNDEPYVYCLFALYAWADGIEPKPDVLQEALDQYLASGRPFQTDLVPRLRILHATAWARAGYPDTARAILAAFENDTAAGLLWYRASAHSVLGDESRALELLKAYLERGPVNGFRVARGRPFSRLHANPEYQRLVGVVGDRR